MYLFAAGDGGLSALVIIFLLILIARWGYKAYMMHQFPELHAQQERQKHELQMQKEALKAQKRQRYGPLLGIGAALFKAWLGHHHRHHDQ